VKSLDGADYLERVTCSRPPLESRSWQTQCLATAVWRKLKTHFFLTPASG
jgi:hypothetical protein